MCFDIVRGLLTDYDEIIITTQEKHCSKTAIILSLSSVIVYKLIRFVILTVTLNRRTRNETNSVASRKSVYDISQVKTERFFRACSPHFPILVTDMHG